MTNKPRTHYFLIKDLLDTLFAPIKESGILNMDAVLTKNNQLQSSPMDICLYKSNSYSLSNRLSGGYITGKLHESLNTEMDILIKNALNEEIDYARMSQALYLIVKPCVSYQEIRDALPDMLIPFLPRQYKHIKALQRDREEAWTIKNSVIAYKNYIAIRPKIEFYSVGRLIF